MFIRGSLTPLITQLKEKASKNTGKHNLANLNESGCKRSQEHGAATVK